MRSVRWILGQRQPGTATPAGSVSHISVLFHSRLDYICLLSALASIKSRDDETNFRKLMDSVVIQARRQLKQAIADDKAALFGQLASRWETQMNALSTATETARQTQLQQLDADTANWAAQTQALDAELAALIEYHEKSHENFERELTECMHEWHQVHLEMVALLEEAGREIDQCTDFAQARAELEAMMQQGQQAIIQASATRDERGLFGNLVKALENVGQ